MSWFKAMRTALPSARAWAAASLRAISAWRSAPTVVAAVSRASLPVPMASRMDAK